MIKFGELLDNPEKSEGEISENYKNIKPIKKMSDADMDDKASRNTA